MSGICGVFSLAGAPVEEQLLRRMAAASAYRGPDGVTCWTQGPAGLAHLAFHTTPEAVRERQPLLDDAGRYCLVADARIDNRDEIIPSLMASGSLRSESPTDAEVILAAYACWGEECGQYLIGDYAFAIWDARERRLFAARDAVGVRQLYYTVAGGVFYFATTLASLLSALPERPALNGPLIYEFLKRRFEWSLNETIYAGVCRLPPAYCLTTAGGGVRLRQYYVWGSQPPPAYRSDEEWILGFRELFDKVLRAQLRSASPVGILVSGGLDSSAVACAVHAIGQRQDIPKVKLVTSLFDHTPSTDERQFFHLVQEACPGFEPHSFLGDEFWGFRDLCAESGYPLDEPDIHPVRAHTVALFRAAADAGCRVVLSGDLANYTLGDAIYYTPRAIRAVARRDRLSEVKYFRRTSKDTWITFLLRAYAPGALLRPYRRVFRNSRHLSGRSSMPWIRRPDRRLEPRSRQGADSKARYADGLQVSAEIILRWSLRAYDQARFGALDVTTAFAGTEQRLPYVDRRIIEFALRMPLHLACSKGLNRVILREGMRGLLPDAIRLRVPKPGLSELVERGWQNERNDIESLLSEPYLGTMGFIDKIALRRCLDETRQGEKPDDGSPYRLYPTLFMEAWLHHTFDNPTDITTII